MWRLVLRPAVGDGWGTASAVQLRTRGGNMDQLRRWVHRHSDASSPHQGGRSAGSLGGAAIISRCSGGVGH